MVVNSNCKSSRRDFLTSVGALSVGTISFGAQLATAAMPAMPDSGNSEPVTPIAEKLKRSETLSSMNRAASEAVSASKSLNQYYLENPELHRNLRIVDLRGFSKGLHAAQNHFEKKEYDEANRLALEVYNNASAAPILIHNHLSTGHKIQSAERNLERARDAENAGKFVVEILALGRQLSIVEEQWKRGEEDNKVTIERVAGDIAILRWKVIEERQASQERTTLISMGIGTASVLGLAGFAIGASRCQSQENTTEQEAEVDGV